MDVLVSQMQKLIHDVMISFESITVISFCIQAKQKAPVAVCAKTLVSL